jgi:hypothetical protein
MNLRKQHKIVGWILFGLILLNIVMILINKITVFSVAIIVIASIVSIHGLIIRKKDELRQSKEASKDLFTKFPAERYHGDPK